MIRLEKIDQQRISSGEKVGLYRLSNSQGVEIEIIELGGAIRSLKTPDWRGDQGDIVLGYQGAQDYLLDDCYMGTLIGRYANRIAGGRFRLGNKSYQLTTNEGGNHLHGGRVGFNKRLWQASEYQDSTGPTLKLTLRSPDGEEGFPGTLDISVVYSLSENNRFNIFYEATTDADTILNLTQHSYFNLSAGQVDTILEHELQIQASHYLPITENLIPDGKFENVSRSPLNFLTSKPIGKDIHSTHPQINLAKGYDHTLALDPGHQSFHKATVNEPVSRRQMLLYTDRPGVQLYTGNSLIKPLKTKVKSDLNFIKWGAFCLEAQSFPDAPNHPLFPSANLSAGGIYRTASSYEFQCI